MIRVATAMLMSVVVVSSCSTPSASPVAGETTIESSPPTDFDPASAPASTAPVTTSSVAVVPTTSPSPDVNAEPPETTDWKSPDGNPQCFDTNGEPPCWLGDRLLEPESNTVRAVVWTQAFREVVPQPTWTIGEVTVKLDAVLDVEADADGVEVERTCASQMSFAGDDVPDPSRCTVVQLSFDVGELPADDEGRVLVDAVVDANGRQADSVFMSSAKPNTVGTVLTDVIAGVGATGATIYIRVESGSFFTGERDIVSIVIDPAWFSDYDFS